MTNQTGTPINPAFKNMLFALIESETMEELTRKKINVSVLGRLKEIVIILSPEKKIQQIKWSKKVYDPKTDEVDIEKEQLEQFCLMLSVDQETMFDENKNFLIKLDFEKQIIFFTKNKKDGSVENQTI